MSLPKEKPKEVRLFTRDADLNDVKRLEASLQAALPAFTADSIARMAAKGLSHGVMADLRDGTKREGVKGNKPKFETPLLMLDLARIIADEQGTDPKKVLGRISAHSEEQGTPSPLERAVRAIQAHHGLPTHGSLRQQKERALKRL